MSRQESEKYSMLLQKRFNELFEMLQGPQSEDPKCVHLLRKCRRVTGAQMDAFLKASNEPWVCINTNFGFKRISDPPIHEAKSGPVKYEAALFEEIVKQDPNCVFTFIATKTDIIFQVKYSNGTPDEYYDISDPPTNADLCNGTPLGVDCLA